MGPTSGVCVAPPSFRPARRFASLPDRPSEIRRAGQQGARDDVAKFRRMRWYNQQWQNKQDQGAQLPDRRVCRRMSDSRPARSLNC